MAQNTSGDMDAAVETLQTTTEALSDPIDDLNEQIDQLSTRMGEVADGMSAFDDTRQQLARVSGNETADAVTGPRAAGD